MVQTIAWWIINVKIKEGKGTEFIICLPVK